MLSRRVLSKVAVLLVLVGGGTAPALAWTAPTRMRLADEAVRLMPPALRLALERHREDLMRGVLAPMTEEDGSAHLPPWGGGRLEEEISGRAEALVRAIEEPGSFRDVVRRFGELAHFVADAGFPPGASGQEGARRYGDFASFCESRLERFPLVFYGHEDRNLEQDDYRAFALEMMTLARTEDRDLARAYALAGNPPDPAAFDDRSVPFAVASLSYSRTVTATVKAWLTAWGKAHGDLGGTPYLRSIRVYRRQD